MERTKHTVVARSARPLLGVIQVVKLFRGDDVVVSGGTRERGAYVLEVPVDQGTIAFVLEFPLIVHFYLFFGWPLIHVRALLGVQRSGQRYGSRSATNGKQAGCVPSLPEAMWKARPVVASRVGGIQDQIVDGVHGVLIADPTDAGAFAAALGRVLNDHPLAARHGGAAAGRVPQRATPPALCCPACAAGTITDTGQPERRRSGENHVTAPCVAAA